MSDMITCVASPPDREKLVVKIQFGNEEWAEINQETDKLILEIYPKDGDKTWVFDYEETVKTLIDAKKHLKEVSSGKSVFLPKKPWWKLF